MDYVFFYDDESAIYDNLYIQDEMFNYSFDQFESQKNSQLPNADQLNGEKEDITLLNQYLNVFKDPTSTSENIIENNQKKMNLTEYKPKMYTKKKVNLSTSAQNFKENFYLIFTNKKKFPKPILKQVHSIMQKVLDLKPISRNALRVSDKYFEEFLPESFKIIQYLVNYKKEILTKIPELAKY